MLAALEVSSVVQGSVVLETPAVVTAVLAVMEVFSVAEGYIVLETPAVLAFLAVVLERAVVADSAMSVAWSAAQSPAQSYQQPSRCYSLSHSPQTATQSNPATATPVTVTCLSEMQSDRLHAMRNHHNKSQSAYQETQNQGSSTACRHNDLSCTGHATHEHEMLSDVDIGSATTHVLSATDTAPIDHLIDLHSFEISG